MRSDFTFLWYIVLGSLFAGHSVVCFFAFTVKIQILYTLLYNMHPKLQRENRKKILVQVYIMHLFYAMRYKLVH